MLVFGPRQILAENSRGQVVMIGRKVMVITVFMVYIPVRIKSGLIILQMNALILFHYTDFTVFLAMPSRHPLFQPF